MITDIVNNHDAIIALATAPGEGAISVIRISGEEAFRITDKMFHGKHKIADSRPNTIHYGKILDKKGEIIDDVLISVFKAPHSYTGENSVEISTHGSQLIVNKIIELSLNLGARLAEPGEFTKRAFLNGKMDLAQAEAVADVINSRTEASLRGARNQLDGLLSQKVDSLRQMLVNASSLIELELDFAEEDVEFLPSEEIMTRINGVVNEINKLLDTYSFGKVIKDGVNVALVGKPNVGKSSLLNYILKESRAIVSEIPGTTRDVIREDVSIDGVLYRLYDTAGIRIAEDTIEKEGVKRSRQVVRDADVVILINDVLSGYDKDLFEELTLLTEKERIINIVNKIDIADMKIADEAMRISAKTGEGIDKLFESLKKAAIGSKSYSEKTAVVSNLRHYNSLKNAKDFLEKAIETVSLGMSGEYISVDMRSAESALGEIIGKVTNDDILNNIFSQFCIGK